MAWIQLRLSKFKWQCLLDLTNTIFAGKRIPAWGQCIIARAEVSNSPAFLSACNRLTRSEEPTLDPLAWLVVRECNKPARRQPPAQARLRPLCLDRSRQTPREMKK